MREIHRYVLNARESMYTTNKYLYLVSTYKLYVVANACKKKKENMLFDIRKAHSASAHVFVIALFISRIIQKRGSEYKLEKYMHK